MYSTGSKTPCCVALGGVWNRFHTVRIQVVHIADTEGGGKLIALRVVHARESILRARDGDNI